MQGIIFDIKRFAVHDGPGIRTTVFLKGCPLRCKWCHNPESWDPEPVMSEKNTMLDGREFREEEQIGRTASVEEVMAEVAKESLIMEESGGGVTFSGGEPLMQPHFLVELLKASCSAGYHTTVDTSGFAPQTDLERILPYTRLFLYDLKFFDPSLHEKYTGVPNGLILDNFRRLLLQSIPVWVRIPVIGGYSGTKKNLTEILDFILPYTREISQVDLLPYHRIGIHKYTRLGIPCEMPGEEAKIPEEELLYWKGIFEKEGFFVKIGG